GLKRLGYGGRITETLPLDVSLPAIGQGALGLEIRAADDDVRALIAPLDDPAAAAAVRAERAFLLTLQGGCQTPIAAYATLAGDRLTLEGMVGRVDGSEILREHAEGPAADPEALGVGLARALAARGAERILEEMRALAGEPPLLT
ncbi:MAG TPA: hydroxymethylbilane synthase, partial [Polyangia bacterium]